MQEIYLDYNGSAPLDPAVAEAMLTLLQGVGNASAAHGFGRRQAAVVESARQQVADLVGGAAGGVVFCAGATEANNLALAGLAEGASERRNRLIISAVEHSSVHEVAHWLADQGRIKADIVGVTREGFVDLDELESLLADDVLAVSVVAANSETGVLNPIAEIAELAKNVGALYHCDATQMAGRLPISMADLGIDLLSLSGHKICGPTGVGALVGTRAALRQIRPLMHGGGHERGLRPGSLNVAGIGGFGMAASIAAEVMASEQVRVERLRDKLVEGLTGGLPSVFQNGDVSKRLPNTLSVRFVGADGDAVVANVDPVAISTGSACNSGSLDPSPVLLAMRLKAEEALESVRFSLGRFTTAQEVDLAVAKTIEAVTRIRALRQGLRDGQRAVARPFEAAARIKEMAR